MAKFVITSFFVILGLFFTPPIWGQSFKGEQLQFPKVRQAYAKKASKIEKLFEKKGIPYPPQEILFRVFKKEKQFEIWAASNGKFERVQTYPLCRVSGTFGPKRKQGDFQTPEGLYYIDRFNPVSSYHLSMGISYPNSADRILSYTSRLGGDIFIHGGCGTRGCIPLTDDKVEEVYLIAVEARNQGQQRIPIHIFPARLDKRGLRLLSKQVGQNNSLVNFWSNLKEAYDFFESNRSLFTISVDPYGKYRIAP